MRSLSNKAQFFIMTSVIIVGVFFTLSKYVNQYSFIDTSRAVEGAEFFMFENIKEKALKTAVISNNSNVESRLLEYKNFVEKMAADRGYSLIFYYHNTSAAAFHFNMTLMSEKYTLHSDFSIDCDSYCRSLGYDYGVCVQNPAGQCVGKGGDPAGEEGDNYCVDHPNENTCCCFPAVS